MCLGWGGTASTLRPDGVVFARAGFLVITFDYRGCGKSDARLISTGRKPEMKDGKLVAEVEEVREVVDPIKDHAILAYERAAGVKKLVSIPGIKHYGVYFEARDRVRKEAIAWFDQNLK